MPHSTLKNIGVLLGLVVFVAIGYVFLFAGTNGELVSSDYSDQSLKVQQTVLGPGNWMGTDTAMPLHADQLLPLAITVRQELVIDSALLEVLTFFLQARANKDPLPILLAYLKITLPEPARSQAEQIARHFQIYMREHDVLLAAQNFIVPSAENGRVWELSDIHRIVTWNSLQHRLQQRILGDEVTRTWYQNEDTQLRQIAEELSLSKDREANSEASYPPTWLNNNDEVRHNRYMQDVLTRATQSVSATTTEIVRWNERYADYVVAKQRILKNTGLTSNERNNESERLLAQTFYNEADRQKVRDRASNIKDIEE